jgi:hypothetical protein
MKTFIQLNLLNIFIFSSIHFLPLPACAIEAKAQDEARSLANEMIQNVFAEAQEAGKTKSALAQLSQENFFKGEDGLLRIDYSTNYIDERSRQEQSYAFALVFVKMDEKNPYQDQAHAFSFEYPLLQLKLVGFQSQLPSKFSFNLGNSINRHLRKMEEFQQRFLPLSLTIEIEKEEYKPAEAITFNVHLRNLSGRPFQVHDLNEQTLYLEYAGKNWGSSDLTDNPGKPVVLKKDDKLTKSFTINAPIKPGLVDVYCSYNMTYSGVKPSTTVSFQIK